MMDAATADRHRRHPHGPWVQLPAGSHFILELHGETFASYEEYQDNLEQWDSYYTYLAETEAENGWLRAAENNEVYAWECEQDELRAQAMGFAY